jgi:hypothetical protein
MNNSLINNSFILSIIDNMTVINIISDKCILTKELIQIIKILNNMGERIPI